MAQHTEAYLTFKAESERLINLTVLFSHAVPVLKRVLGSHQASALVQLKQPDNFPHDDTTGSELLVRAAGYEQDLAHVIVLSIFSYFEAYVRGALDEVYARQGGQQAFIALAEKRATRYWTSLPPAIAEAKHKLQTVDKKGKAEKYKKYSRILVEAGFSFPPDILSVYGARKLKEKLDARSPRALRAWEIPDLLTDALLFNVTAAEKTMFTDVRKLRNKVAHGSKPTLSVHAAIKKTSALRKWATRIDTHIGQHFLVLAKYAPS
jgi:hypothetical protein